jgi:hypothetical protein
MASEYIVWKEAIGNHLTERQPAMGSTMHQVPVYAPNPMPVAPAGAADTAAARAIHKTLVSAWTKRVDRLAEARVQAAAIIQLSIAPSMQDALMLDATYVQLKETSDFITIVARIATRLISDKLV